MRFFVRESYIDGHAVIDKATSSLVLSSLDGSAEGRDRLQRLADALNAALDPRYEDHRTDAYKRCPDGLKWRVIEYCSPFTGCPMS